MDTLHLHLYLPSSGQLFKVMDRVRPKGTLPDVLEKREIILDAGRTCQELHVPPFPFRQSTREDDLPFNVDVAMDLIWL